MDFSKGTTSETLLRRIRNSALFSQRSLLTLMALTGLANAYLMRLCLNLTIRAMTEDKTSKSFRASPNFNLYTKSTMMDGTELVEYSVERSTRKSYKWKEETNDLEKLAFFSSYALLHMPGSYLAQKFGGKTILNLGLFWLAVCTLTTPVVGQYGGAKGLINLKYFSAIGEVPVSSALLFLLSGWIPKNERGRVSSIVFCAGQVGSIMCNILIVSSRESIEGCSGTIFYTIGVLGLLWNIAFHFLVYDTPSSHPRISATEKEYLHKEIGDLIETKEFFQIPWSSMLTSPAVWVLIFVQWGHEWGFYVLASEFPNYLKLVLKFNYIELAWYTSLSFMVSFMSSVLCGVVCDDRVNRELVSRTRARKIFTVTAAMVSAPLILIIYYGKYGKTAAVIFYTLAMGFMSAFYTGGQANLLDLCPNYSAVLMGIVSGTGAFCGYLAPFFTDLFTPTGVYSEWEPVFCTSFVLLLLSLLTYYKWASGEVQPWNEKIDQVKRMKESIEVLFRAKT